MWLMKILGNDYLGSNNYLLIILLCYVNILLLLVMNDTCYSSHFWERITFCKITWIDINHIQWGPLPWLLKRTWKFKTKMGWGRERDWSFIRESWLPWPQQAHGFAYCLSRLTSPPQLLDFTYRPVSLSPVSSQILCLVLQEQSQLTLLFQPWRSFSLKGCLILPQLCQIRIWSVSLSGSSGVGSWSVQRT